MDAHGFPSDFDPLQADLCEYIRSAYYAGLLGNKTDGPIIKEAIFENIACAGSDIPENQICAVNNNSYFEKESWVIFLDGSYMNVKNLIGR